MMPVTAHLEPVFMPSVPKSSETCSIQITLDGRTGAYLPSGLFNLLMQSLPQDIYSGELAICTSCKKDKKDQAARWT